MPDGASYIVRGAKMRCSCGSHPRRINLPVSHGSYVEDKPMMNEADSRLLVNIEDFGICNSPANPNNAIIYLIAEDKSTISGKKCCPVILSNWINTQEKTKVEGKAALTTQSQLICALGGIIGFTSDGQQDK